MLDALLVMLSADTAACSVVQQVQSRSRANTADLGSKEVSIQIPGFQRLTDVPKVSDTELACTQAPLEERAYIRHIEKTQEELDDQVEYDLDSDDEHWLDNRHKKVSLRKSLPLKLHSSYSHFIRFCNRHKVEKVRCCAADYTTY